MTTVRIAHAEPRPGNLGHGIFITAGPDIRGPLTYGAALTGSEHNLVAVAEDRDWTRHELVARVPADSDTVVFGIFLAGPGRIELRHPELIRGT